MVAPTSASAAMVTFAQNAAQTHTEPSVERNKGATARLRITHLLTRYSERPVWARFTFLNGFVTIGNTTPRA